MSPTDAELTALADGSLAPERRRALAAAVARSPERAALLDEQRRAVARLRGLDIAAPADLVDRIVADRPRNRRRARLRAARLGAGLAGALAAAVVLGILLVPAGTPTAPTVVQAAALAQRGPVGSAPRSVRDQPNLLAVSTAGLAFPNYRASFGWKASGIRADDLRGRVAQTVFYARDGQQIAYTIVAGPALEPRQATRRSLRGGTVLRSFRQGGRTVVTWLRAGHTCVLTGAVPADELLELAAWRGKGAVTF